MKKTETVNGASHLLTGFGDGQPKANRTDAPSAARANTWGQMSRSMNAVFQRLAAHRRSARLVFWCALAAFLFFPVTGWSLCFVYVLMVTAWVVTLV
jgi:hypothetical protein